MLTSVLIFQHQIGYLLVSGLICITASAATLWLRKRNQEDRNFSGGPWLGFQAIAAGSGLWAANVVALLGFHPGAAVGIQPWAIVLSLVAGVAVAMPIAFLYSRRRTLAARPGVLGSSAAIAVAFAIVYYLAVAGLHVHGRLHWNLWVQLEAIAAMCALTIAARLAMGVSPTLKSGALAVVLLILAKAALHFISLAGLTITPETTGEAPAGALGNLLVAALVTTLALAMLAISAAATVLAAFGEEKALGRLRTAINAMPSALALFDSSDRLVVWNISFELAMGSRRAEAREGMPLRVMLDSMPMDGAPPESREIDSVRRQRQSFDFPIPGDRWIHVDNVPTEDGGLLSLGTDVTEMRRSEVALAQALQRAEAASEAKSSFLAAMSHEIRTPLNGVLGMAQAMELDELSGAQRQRLEVIRSAGEYLLTVLNDVLDISKIEAGRIEIEDGVVDFKELVEATLRTYSTLAAEKGIRLAGEVDPAVGGVWRGDPARVRQILHNLVSNAVKFTDLGSVDIRVSRYSGDIVIEVADTGPGVAIERQEQIFDKFAQADASTTRRHGGTGLGLTISRQLAQLMGGDIVLRSAPGEGACFAVRLPMERAEAAAAAEAEPEAAPPEAGLSLRVLAAEDNPTNQIVLRTLLAQVGIEPEIVSDGLAAVQAWAAGGWDLILMDVQMPVMDGPTAAARIREEERRRGLGRTPIIALTANAMAHHAEIYRQAGMDSMVPKPIRMTDLVRAIQDAAAHAADETPEAKTG